LTIYSGDRVVGVQRHTGSCGSGEINTVFLPLLKSIPTGGGWRVKRDSRILVKYPTERCRATRKAVVIKLVPVMLTPLFGLEEATVTVCMTGGAATKTAVMVQFPAIVKLIVVLEL